MSKLFPTKIIAIKSNVNIHTKLGKEVFINNNVGFDEEGQQQFFTPKISTEVRCVLVEFYYN